MNVLAPPAGAAMHATSLHDERLKRRVLFMVDGRATLEQQAGMIEALERTGRWACHLVGDAITLDARDAPGAARIVDWSGVAAPRSPTGETSDKAAIDGPEVKRRWRPLRHPSMAIPRELITALLLAARWIRQRAAARKHLRSLAPSCMVTAQARTETALPIAAAAADLGIPVILVTTGGLFMPDGGAYMRRHHGSCSLDRAADSVAPGLGQQWLNRLVGWLLPDQLFHSRWGRMLHRPAHWYIAGFLARICPSRAWFNGTRFVDAVVVSGDDERRVCRCAGIPDVRLAPIGHPAFQVQYERRRQRERLRAELGVEKGRTLLVVSSTPLWEHKLLDEAGHVAYVDRLLKVLSGRDAEILLSLHPKMKPERYRPLVEAAGLRLAERPLIEILAAADLFIAGAYSSTIRWAMAICIPCINLDLWKLEESTYRDMPDYPTVRSWDAVEQWLDTRLSEGPRAPNDCVPPMGLICDGQFPEKFVALVDRLAGQHA
jgi:hypothetical protein